MASQSLLASDHQIRIDSEQGALDAMVIQVPGLIVKIEDVSPQFFDLRNGLASSVFQKFMSYNCRAVFIVPDDHTFGPRVTELAREHSRHPHVRILPSVAGALDWLKSF